MKTAVVRSCRGWEEFHPYGTMSDDELSSYVTLPTNR